MAEASLLIRTEVHFPSPLQTMDLLQEELLLHLLKLRLLLVCIELLNMLQRNQLRQADHDSLEFLNYFLGQYFNTNINLISFNYF